MDDLTKGGYQMGKIFSLEETQMIMQRKDSGGILKFFWRLGIWTKESIKRCYYRLFYNNI